jgi:DNA mismatch repair protein MutS2
VGLFTLMAMCGLMIPADENSEVAVFRRVLADIGDEQSIEQSLSTFSAHMTNIIGIIGRADGNSLVLLDELGAGTDPVEGAALAMAILEELRRRGAKVAATTHYAELKAYALQTEGVENACCEFDVATLRPTYRLLIGVPGRSNAFAISLRLGMDGKVVERAKELVSSENTRFEDVVQSLEASRQSLEKEREAAARERAEAQKAVEEAHTLRDGIRADADGELERARQKAAELVSRTRGQMDALLLEMDEIRRQKDRSAASEEIAKMRAGFRKLESTADPVNRRQDGKYVLPRPLKAGDSVLIYDIDKKGTVLRAPDGNSGEVLVQAGIVQTRVPLSNLRLVEEKPERKVYRTVTAGMRGKPSAGASSELDLRGQMTDEAVMNVDRFIDSAQLAGVGQLTIIHGKGTGALRTAVQQHLKHHPGVKSFRLGTFGEGESGVTIVELK